MPEIHARFSHSSEVSSASLSALRILLGSSLEKNVPQASFYYGKSRNAFVSCGTGIVRRYCCFLLPSSSYLFILSENIQTLLYIFL